MSDLPPPTWKNTFERYDDDVPRVVRLKTVELLSTQDMVDCGVKKISPVMLRVLQSQYLLLQAELEEHEEQLDKNHAQWLANLSEIPPSNLFE